MTNDGTFTLTFSNSWNSSVNSLNKTPTSIRVKSIPKPQKMITFEEELTNLQVLKKYLSFSKDELKDILKRYTKNIIFIHDDEKEDNECSDYLPIGHFQINHYKSFVIDKIEGQCGLRAVNRNHDCFFPTDFYAPGYKEEKLSTFKLNIVLFTFILKTMEGLVPEILLLFSDVKDNISDKVLSMFAPPVYSFINPNSGNMINYYLLNIKHLKIPCKNELALSAGK